MYISSHGEARNSKFVQQVNLIQRVRLHTLTQKVLISLTHIQISLSLVTGATVIKFGQ